MDFVCFRPTRTFLFPCNLAYYTILVWDFFLTLLFILFHPHPPKSCNIFAVISGNKNTKPSLKIMVITQGVLWDSSCFFLQHLLMLYKPDICLHAQMGSRPVCGGSARSSLCEHHWTIARGSQRHSLTEIQTGEFLHLKGHPLATFHFSTWLYTKPPLINNLTCLKCKSAVNAREQHILPQFVTLGCWLYLYLHLGPFVLTHFL